MLGWRPEDVHGVASDRVFAVEGRASQNEGSTETRNTKETAR